MNDGERHEEKANEEEGNVNEEVSPPLPRHHDDYDALGARTNHLARVLRDTAVEVPQEETRDTAVEVPQEETHGCTIEVTDLEAPPPAMADYRASAACDSNSNNEDKSSAEEENGNDYEASLQPSGETSNDSSTAQDNHISSADELSGSLSPISELLHRGREEVTAILQNTQSRSSLSQQDYFQMRHRHLLSIADIVAGVNRQRLNDTHGQLCERPQNLSPEDTQHLKEILQAGLTVGYDLIDRVPTTNDPLDIVLSKPVEEDEQEGYNEGLLKKLKKFSWMNVFFGRLSMQAANTVNPTLETFCHVLNARIVVCILTFDSVRSPRPLAEFLCGFARFQRYLQEEDAASTPARNQPIPLVIDAMPGSAWLASSIRNEQRNILEEGWSEDLRLLFPFDMVWPDPVMMTNLSKQEHQLMVVKKVKNAMAGRQSCQPRTRLYILVSIVVVVLSGVALIIVFLVLPGDDHGPDSPPENPLSLCLAGSFLTLRDGLMLSGSNTAAPALEEGSPAFACAPIFSIQSRVVYYQLRGDGNCYTISSEGSTLDAVLGLLVGTSCDDTQCLASSNVEESEPLFDTANTEVPPASDLHMSTLFLKSVQGQDHWLVVGGFEDSVGDYMVQFASGSCFPTTSPTNSQQPSVRPSALPTTPTNHPTSAPTAIWRQLGADIEGDNVTSDLSLISVALSSDGFTVAIGSLNNGCCGQVRVYSYDMSTTQWNQQGEDLGGRAENDEFGRSVSLSANGLILAVCSSSRVGGGNLGYARVFAFTTSAVSWNQQGQDLGGGAAEDFFGCPVDLSGDGLVLAVGTTVNDSGGVNSGLVRVYAFDSATSDWVQRGQHLQGEAAGGLFGSSVAVSVDGMIVATGEPARRNGNGSIVGQVRVFAYQTSMANWTQLGQDIDGEEASDLSGWAVALSFDGRTVAVGAPLNGNSGHVRVWSLPQGSSSWTQMGQDLDGEAADDRFGNSLALSADGQTVAVGAPGNGGNGLLRSGQVSIFSFNPDLSEWQQVGEDLNGRSIADIFGGFLFSGQGVALSADGRIMAAGAQGNARNGVTAGGGGGDVWVFARL